MRRYTVLAVDPSLTRTGIAVYDAPGQVLDGRVVLVPGQRRLLAALSGGERADGGLRWLWLEAAGHLPLDQPVISAVERPPPVKRGIGMAPTAAEREALRWIDDLARERARVLGVRYRKATPLRPQPQQWRAPIGLATHAPAGLSERKQDRSDWLKAQAVLLATLEVTRCAVPGAPITIDTDSAEAICLGSWAITSVGTLGTWFRAGAKPQPLRAAA